MYYKIIVYKKKFVDVETKRGISKKVYFQKITAIHNIHTATLSKKHIETFQKYAALTDGWQLVLDEMKEDEDEKQSLIYKNNEKVKKYFEMVGV